MSVLTFIVLLILSGLIGLLSGCMTPEKAKAFLVDKGKLAEICADTYPVKTEYIKGDSTVVFDTLHVGNDPVFDTLITLDTVYITKTLPGKVIQKTIRVTDTVVKENTARVEQYRKEAVSEQVAKEKAQSERDGLKADVKVLKKQRNKWRLWFFLLLSSVIIYKFRGTIFKLIKPI